MSYNIDDVRCPQCGDRRKSKSGTYYKCENCRAQYFVDAQGIATNVADMQRKAPPSDTPPPMPKMQGTTPPPFIPKPGSSEGYDKNPSYNREEKKKGKANYIYWIVPIFLLIFGGVIFGMYRFYKYIDGKPGLSTSSSGGSYHVSNELSFPVAVDDALYVVSVGKRNYYKGYYSNRELDSRNGYYYSIVDIMNEEEVVSERLDINDIDRIYHRRFSNGKDLIVFGKNRVYELDHKSITLVDVTDELFGDDSNPDLSVGIAKIEFPYESDFEGFKIMNNQGKEFKYNPYILTKYPESRNEYLVALGNMKDTTYYAFSSKSITCRREMSKDEEVQLLKITSKYLGVEPEKPQWNEPWMVSNRTEPVLFSDEDLVKTSKNLTPGKFYFFPKVVYYDNDGRLLIKYNKSPDEDSQQYLKCIDSETGKEKWTINLDGVTKYNYFFTQKESVFAGGYYLIKSDMNEYLLISEDGSEMEECEISTFVE